MDKRSPSERENCRKFDLAAVNRARCDEIAKLTRIIGSQSDIKRQPSES